MAPPAGVFNAFASNILLKGVVNFTNNSAGPTGGAEVPVDDTVVICTSVGGRDELTNVNTLSLLYVNPVGSDKSSIYRDHPEPTIGLESYFRITRTQTGRSHPFEI